jgi:undecaprenyl-diphosphatase
MPVWKAALLGLVQGLAEFLPVSSSGHLKLAEHYLGLPIEDLLSFDVLLHVATLLAILIYFRADLVKVFGGFFASLPRVLRKGGWQSLDAWPEAKLGWLVALTLIPTGIVAVLFGDVVEGASIQIVSLMLLLTGGVNL